MHADTHTCMLCTQRKGEWESPTLQEDPREKSTQYVGFTVTARSWFFTLQVQTQKLTDQPKRIQQHSPTTMGSNLTPVIQLGVGIPPVQAGRPPSLSIPQCHLSPGRWCQKGSRAPLPVCSLQRSGFVAAFLSHPRSLCAVGGCCTPNFTAFCLLLPRPRGFWTTSVSSNMSQRFP